MAATCEPNDQSGDAAAQPTPAMVNAGADALQAWQDAADPWTLARLVYAAMRSAADSSQEGVAVVESILREMFELAKPDDLAFLEMQVSYIAGRIVDGLARKI